MTPLRPRHRAAGAALPALSPRVLLFVLLLILGVVAMHTLGAGHLTPAPSTQAGVHRVDATSADMGLPLAPTAAAVHAAAGAGCGADPVGCTTAGAGMSDHMGAMCLAVLPTALGLALLLLAALWWARPPQALQARHALTRAGIRAGPWPALTPPLLRTAVLRI